MASDNCRGNRRIQALLIPWIVLASAITAFAQEIKPGDKVTVIKWDAEIKSENAVVSTPAFGASYVVDKVDGGLLWVQSHNGYLRREDVEPYDQAVEQFTNQLLKNPESWELYYKRALVKFQRGEHETAILDFTAAIERNSTSANAYGGRADSLLAMKELDKAIVDYTVAIQFANDNRLLTYLHHFRGHAWQQLGDDSVAAADFAMAARIAENNSELWNHAAWILATSLDATARDGALAVKYAHKACEHSSVPNPNLIDTLAAAYAELGEFRHAAALQQKAIDSLEAGTSADTIKDFESRKALYSNGENYRQVIAASVPSN